MANTVFVVKTGGGYFVIARSVFPCNGNPSVGYPFFVVLWPRAPSIAPRILLLSIPAQVHRKFVVWLESNFKLIIDQLEEVALTFCVPHEFVWFDVMGILALGFLAVWACVLFWLVVLVLPLLLFPKRPDFFCFLVFVLGRLT